MSHEMTHKDPLCTASAAEGLRRGCAGKGSEGLRSGTSVSDVVQNLRAATRQAIVPISASPVMVAQRQQIMNLFGSTAETGGGDRARHLPAFQARMSPAGLPVVQRHHQYGKGQLSDGDLSDVEIYRVVRKKDDEVVYVGQTCIQVGYEARFEQHLKTGYHGNWSKATHRVERIEGGNWTLLEAMTAEQYWIDKYGGVSSLENAVNALRLDTWVYYRNDAVTTPNFKGQYRPKA